MNSTQNEDELDSLYNPDITDLMRDEHQGIDRPVVYLGDVKPLIAKAENRGRISVLRGLDHDKRHHNADLHKLVLELINDYETELCHTPEDPEAAA